MISRSPDYKFLTFLVWGTWAVQFMLWAKFGALKHRTRQQLLSCLAVIMGFVNSWKIKLLVNKTHPFTRVTYCKAISSLQQDGSITSIYIKH